MALNPFVATLGFTTHGNFIDNIEAKQIFCKTLDVDGNVDIDGNLVVTGTFAPTGTATFTNLIVTGNTTLGDTSGDELLVNANSSFQVGAAAPNTSGFRVTGTTTATVAGVSTTLNGKMGTVTFTGVTIAGNDAQDFTILNANAGLAGIVALTNDTGGVWANGSDPKIEDVNWNLNTSVVVRVRNYSAATSTGASTFVISFHSFT